MFTALVLACVVAAAVAEHGKAGYSAPTYTPVQAVRGAGVAGPHQGPGGPGGYQPGSGGFKTPVGSANQHEQYQYEPSPYAFDYAVNHYETGADYAANEAYDGKQTTGFYKVALPDGRVQTVKYTVDDFGGFNAEVSYEGSAVYPEPSEYQHQAAPVGAVGYGSGKRASLAFSKPASDSYKPSPNYRGAPLYKSDADDVSKAYKAPPKYE